MRRRAPQASRQLLEEEFHVESVVLNELQTQIVEQASSDPLHILQGRAGPVLRVLLAALDPAMGAF